MVKAVREFINDFLGGAYDGLLADGKAMVKRNGEMMWDNGKCFGYDMMKNLDSPAFKRLIKEGLRKFSATKVMSRG